jgi:integrase
MSLDFNRKIIVGESRKPHLTETICAGAKPPATGKITLWDDSPTGLGLSITHRGSKSWILKYRVNGVQRKLTIGNYPGITLDAARKAAIIALGQIAIGNDPAQEKIDKKLEESGADTFKALSERYITQWARPRKRTWDRDEAHLKNHLLPAWGKSKAKDITRKDVITLIDKYAEESPIAANRLLALVSKIFNFGMSKDIVEYNPAYRLEKPSKEHPGDRRLSDEELLTVWKVLDTEPFIAASAYRMLMLTACRLHEVLDMKWSEIDWTKNIWTIPAARTKNKRDHRVPLVGMALEIIESIKSQHHAGEWVFYSNVKDQPLTKLTRRQDAILKATNLKHFTLHNLRRTVATGLGNLGVADATISRILNHVSGPRDGGADITLIYNRAKYDTEKRAALELWDSHVRELTATESEPTSQIA